MKWFLLFAAAALVFADEPAQEEEGEKDVPPTLDFGEGTADPTVATEENGVFVLTPTNFDKFIASHDNVMVEFYAPWCGHCKSLAPQYDEAAAELKSEGVNAVLAKVDADAHQALGNRFGVQGFPTLKMFKKGQDAPIDYEDGRNKFGIVEKMKELADPNWQPPKSVVIELTTATFDDIVNSQPIMLVEFFAPWCGHCKKLKPAYENAARRLLEFTTIPLATVDATVEKDLATRYGVTGYPTLKIFRKGKASEFTGGRTADDIVNTMLVEKDPHTVEIQGSYAKREAEKPTDVAVIGAFPDLSTESIEYKMFEELTNDYRESYKSRHTFETAFITKTFKGISKPSIIVAYPASYVAKKEKAFKSMPVTAETTVEQLAEFVRTSDKPLAGNYDCDKCEKIYDVVDTVRVYLSKDYGTGEDKNTKYWQEKTAIVAKKFKGKGIHFVLCDESKQDADMRAMRITDLGQETVFGIKTAKGAKYSPDIETLEDMDDFVETLIEFVEDFLEGKLPVRRKSAAIPKKQTGPVTVVVGDSFADVVQDNSKDVLIEFYAPWCGHCKALEPKYIQLANDVRGETSLVIAKIDATANEVPSEFNVQGFPAIYMVPANGKAPVEYSGSREVDDLKKFIKEHADIAFGGSAVRDEL